MQVYIYITGGFDWYFYPNGYHRTLAGAMRAVEAEERGYGREGTWVLNAKNPSNNRGDTCRYWLYNGSAIYREELED